MNEQYSFDARHEAFGQLTLEDSEIKTLQNLGLQPEDLAKLLKTEPFAEGSYALLFNLPEQQPQQVAKVWKNPDIASDRAIHENTALRLLRRKGYEYAPRLSGYLKSATILFEEKVAGRPIEEFNSKSLEQLAVALTALHSIELSSYGKPDSPRCKGTRLDCLREGLADLRRRIFSSHNMSEEIKQLIEYVIKKIEDTAISKAEAFSQTYFSLIHFDLNPNNILQTDDGKKLVIIDWEQASAGDNAMDLAKMFLKLNFTDSQKEIFLSEYERMLPHKDIYLRTRLDTYEQFVLINSILWRISVLEDEGRQEVSEKGQQFYNRVQVNLATEIELLKSYISN